MEQAFRGERESVDHLVVVVGLRLELPVAIDHAVVEGDAHE